MIKFSVNSGDFFNRLQTLAKAQASKTSLSILEYVKIEVADGAIMLTAGDSDNMIQTTISVDVKEGSGESICIRTDNLLVGLRELPNQPITITAAPEAACGIRVDYSNGHYEFVGMDSSDYPSPIAMANDARNFFLLGKKLQLGIACTKKMVANDELRPVMCGVFFDLKTANRLTMVASNGNALARETYDIANAIEPISFNLPLKASLLLSSIIGKDDDEVQISVDDRNAKFTTNSYTMISKLVEGKYPNYNSVIPTDNPIVVSIPKDSLVGSLRRVLISANESTPLIQMTLKDNSLLLSANDAAFGSASEETINCDYDGNEFAIGFKGTLLLDILSVMPAGNVKLMLSDPSRAAVLTPEEKIDGEDLTMLCMPMMLNP